MAHASCGCLDSSYYSIPCIRIISESYLFDYEDIIFLLSPILFFFTTPPEFYASILPFGIVISIEDKLIFILVIKSEKRDQPKEGPFPFSSLCSVAYIRPCAQFMIDSVRKTNSILPTDH